MPDEDQLSLRQADHIRADFPATENGLEFVMEQIAALPTRWDLAKYAFVGHRQVGREQAWVGAGLVG